MVHDDERWTKKVLDDMSKYTNEIYVNLNDPTPIAEEAVLSHPNVKDVIRTTNDGRWNQGLQRDNTTRMVDNIKPDIVIFPDSDEIFPKNLDEQLKSFWEDEDKRTFWFRLLYLWGNENKFRNDSKFKSIHHVRIFKWQPEITFLPYAGYTCPTNFINLDKNTRFHSNSPILHYGYMHEEDRLRKYERNNSAICNEETRKEINKNILIRNTPDILL